MIRKMYYKKMECYYDFLVLSKVFFIVFVDIKDRVFKIFRFFRFELYIRCKLV